MQRAESQHNEELLEMIKAKAKDSKDGEALTWNALYSLKEKEIELKHKMDEEMEAVRDKYRLLKQPIFTQISDVVLGNRVDKQLYQGEGLPKPADPAKVNPKAIEDFWGIVLEKVGLLCEEVDAGVSGSIAEFLCKVVDPKNNHLRIVFSFRDNDYFTNHKLEGEYCIDL